MSNKKQAQLSTEVSSKASRRRFRAAYKARILAEAAACHEQGALGALLRREGLYTSHLCKWRKTAEKAQLSGLAPKKRGPKSTDVDERDRQIVEQQRLIAKLTRRAERAEALVELQKKVSQILGVILPSAEESS